MLGCDVIPERESTATSTTSAPASAAASMEATPAPAVSWVCMWIGSLGNWARREPTNSEAPLGFKTPAMSYYEAKEHHQIRQAEKLAVILVWTNEKRIGISQFTIFTETVMQLVYPPPPSKKRFSNSSRVLQSFQEKSKKMVMQNFLGEKRCINVSMKESGQFGQITFRFKVRIT